MMEKNDKSENELDLFVKTWTTTLTMEGLIKTQFESEREKQSWNTPLKDHDGEELVKQQGEPSSGIQISTPVLPKNKPTTALSFIAVLRCWNTE